MFYLVGLGLGDTKDITVKGLEVIRKCKRVYLEAYTSILSVGKETLEEFYGKELLLADRELCESGADEILAGCAEGTDVALLVVGDPLGATTHTDLLLRAKECGIKTQVIHNASIMNAVSCCGLQLYRFGETVSIPYWTETWKPSSFFDKILENHKRDLHTLCLLDIKVKEPTEESLTKKVRKFMDPKFMSVKEASEQLLNILTQKISGDGNEPEISSSSLVIGLARVGSDDQAIIVCSLREMSAFDLGPPLHTLVFPAANLHPLEIDFLNQFQKK